MDVPRDLGEHGRALWTEVTADYSPLRADRVEMLAQACRELDLIAQIDAEFRLCEPRVLGSMRQPVAHPLLQELRCHRELFARLLRELRLGGSRSASNKMSSERGRAMARARWSNRSSERARRWGTFNET